jgi:uncharacterized repeat protein (TIGR03803 family)
MLSILLTRRGGVRRARRRRGPGLRLLDLERLEDRTLPSGSAAHPAYVLFHPSGTMPAGSPTPYTTARTPAQIDKAYGINLLSADGSGETVAIVDAYDDPNFVSRSPTLSVNSDTAFLASDLHQFDAEYGLPEPAGFFTKVNQSGGTTYPSTDPAGAGNPFGNWEAEEALDVEWVHSVAPGAKIILVEANDNSDANLFAAVSWAGGHSGAQVVSMSWGQGEFSGELANDSSFVQPAGHGVTYVASTGDSGQPGEYPAFSPDVLAAGGTTLTGGSTPETGWSGSGGGISQYEPQPAYQSSLTQYAPHRTIPDLSFDADPNSGVSVYDEYNAADVFAPGPWWQFGGTSLSAPCLSAVISLADQLRAQTGQISLAGPTQTLPALYKLPAGDFHDVTTGNNGYPAGPGYDLVTGIGTPVANNLVPDLAGLTYVPVPPLGSLVYQKGVSGTISSTTSTVNSTLNITSGQTIAVVVNPVAGLQVSVQLSDPLGNVLGTASSGASGQSVLLQTLPAASTGTYTLTVAGVRGTGTFTGEITFNAALDANAEGGPPNNSLAAAQDIDSSFLSLGGPGAPGTSRGAVVGTMESSGQDYYSFSLSAGDSATLAVKAVGGAPTTVALVNGSGTTLATGTTGAANSDEVIADFTAPSSDSYYALVSGTPNTEYNLVITRNAGFDTGGNSSLARAVLPLGRWDGTADALGYIQAATTKNGARAEFYALPLEDSANFQAETATPGEGPGAFDNLLDPMLVLLNSSGTPVAQASNSAPDGHNALLNYTVPAGQGGAYSLEVLASTVTSTPTFGEYVLSLNGLSRAAAFTPSSLANWTVNQPGYSQILNIRGAPGTMTFTTAGGLPPGITLSSSGLLAGTPTATGSYPFMVTATDSGGDSASRSYTVTINPPVAVTTPQPATGTAGVFYSQAFSATGGTGAVTFSASGALPAGMTLGSTGLLSGTPTTAGSFLFTVTATDSVGATGSQTYTMYVFAFSPSTLPVGTVTEPNYNQAITVTGGIAPYTFRTTGGLPPGLTLSSSGVLSGMPSAAGTSSFQVIATDNGGNSTGENYALTINPAPAPEPILITLASFNNTNGSDPGNLVGDTAGNLFGTAGGGTNDDGTVFEIARGSGSISVLANFNLANGLDPSGNLVLDSRDNLFGTTNGGGPYGPPGYGGGTVFEVPRGSSSIADLVFFNPMNSNGGSPQGGLVADSSGDLFGTTSIGGPGQGGTVFEIPRGSSSLTTLATFDVNSGGYGPMGSLVVDSAGNLFGTTTGGGPYGTVFEVAKGSGNITTLANFNGNNGAGPTGTLTEDSNGNLFGTTQAGGTYGLGNVFEVQKGSGNVTSLASFNISDGNTPLGGVIEDSSGNLFGTVSSLQYYGGGIGYGDIFEVAQGSGTITTLVKFNGSNGAFPAAGLVEDSSGNLYGTTTQGGPSWIGSGSGYGTVFEISKTLPGWTVGQPGYSQSFAASGGTGAPTFSLTGGDLPPGMALSASGVLSGTPTAAGSYAFTVTATDSVGGSGSLTYSIIINPLPTLQNASWTVNQPCSAAIISGGTAPFTITQTGGTLPPGLGPSPNGDLVGTPTSTGTYSFFLTVTDLAGSTVSGTVTMTVNPPVTILAFGPASWTINQPYSQTFVATQGTGDKTFTYSGILPPGLTLSTTGLLSGTPTAAGTYAFTLIATDAVGASGTRSYSVTINSPVMITSANHAAWNAGVPFTQALLATGGTGNKTISVPSAGLPPGISLQSAQLTGTPTIPGTYTFTITATDTTGASGSQVYTLTINPPLVVSPSTLPSWTLDQSGYSQAIFASGGAGSLSLSESGPLPPGLTLSSGFVLSGTPTATGTYTFLVTATDALGLSSSQSYAVTINPAISLTATLPADTISIAYNQTITASGGTGALMLTVTNVSGAIAGLNVPASGTGTVSITGTPTATGTELFIVTATDAVGAMATQSYLLVVNPAVSITTTSLSSWTQNGAGYSQSITVSGGAGTVTFSGANLPPGLMLNSAGLLSGTPTTAGSFIFTVTASDTLGSSNGQSCTLTINPPVAITTATLAAWTLNQPGYHQTIAASGGTGTLTFSATGPGAPGLPSGLALSTAGTLSGTPASSGTYTFTVTATDSVGASSSQDYTVTINPQPWLVPGVLTSGLLNAEYKRTITALGGTGAVSLVVTNISGPLPGIILPSSGTGAIPISGTPTALGTESFTVTAIDALGATTAVSYSITINPATVYLTLPSSGFSALPGGKVLSFPISINELQDQGSPDHVGLASATLALTFSTGVFTFPTGTNGAIGDVSLGSVPLSDTASPGGAGDWTLTATAPADGQLNITLLARSGKNITDPAGGGTLVTINFPVSSSYNPAAATTQAITVVGANGSFHTAITGNNGQYTLKPLPPYAGSLTIFPTLAITTTTLANGTIGEGGYNQTIRASGGAGPLTFSETGVLPPGLTLSSSGVLAGTPTALGNYSFTVTVTDPLGNSAGQTYTVTINPLTYQVMVAGGSTVEAGRGFVVVLQAADALGHPITNYQGPGTVTVSASPTSRAGNFPATVAINSSGLGLFLGSVDEVGSYTITASSGSFTGSSNPVTVVPGPAARLAFLAQPVSTPTGVVLPAVTVQVQDLYGNVVLSDNTDVVSLEIASGPGPGAPGFTAASTSTATMVNGVATFNNLMLVVPGTYTLSAFVPGQYTGPYSNAFTIAPLQVLPGTFAGTPSGFSLEFNAPYLVDSLTPVLYGQGYGPTAPAPSVIVTTDPGNLSDTAAYVEGSLVLDPASNRITFVATNTALEANTGAPVLPDGTYTVIVRSSAATDGFQALNAGGGFLDGLANGTPGSSDFTASFVVHTAGDDTLWVPDVADGPGQALNAPGMNQAGGGYPVYLSDGYGVTAVQLTLNYNPSLLQVTGVTGAGFALSATSTPGHAVLVYNGPALASRPGTPETIGYLTAQVPGGTAGDPTPYRAKDLLHLSAASINGDSSHVVIGDALHLVAYVGDGDGNGSYSGNDAALITRVALQTDSGFAAYPLVDSVIVADTDGSGFIPADAALEANEAGVDFPTPSLPSPPVPSGVVFQVIGNNVDPSLTIPSDLPVRPDGTVVVPVILDDPHPQGSTGLTEAHLALTYDPRRFTVTAADIHLGSLLEAGSGWSLVPTINPATGQIAIALSSTTPLTSTPGGSLVSIDVHALRQVGNPSSCGVIELVPSVNPTGTQVVCTELEDAQGTFTLSPAPGKHRR